MRWITIGLILTCISLIISCLGCFNHNNPSSLQPTDRIITPDEPTVREAIPLLPDNFEGDQIVVIDVEECFPGGSIHRSSVEFVVQ